MTDNKGPTSTEDALAASRDACARFVELYGKAGRLLGCHHLPALPGEADQPIDTSAALAEMHQTVTTIALAITDRKSHPLPLPCACRVLPLVEELGFLASALTDVLNAARGVAPGNDGDSLASTRKRFTTRAATVERMSDGQLVLLALARAYAEGEAGPIQRVFRRAAKAGCVHIPAAALCVFDPATSMAALRRLQTMAWRTHHALAEAVYPDCCWAHSGAADDSNDGAGDGTPKPKECCAAVPAAISAGLVALTKMWSELLDGAYIFAVFGEATVNRAMREKAGEIAAAAEALLTEF